MDPIFARRSFLSHLLAGAAGVALWPCPQAARAAGTVAFSTDNLSLWRAPIGEWLLAETVALDPADPKKLSVKAESQSGAPAVLVNGSKGRTVNLLTKAEHRDARVQIEFMVPKGSNSGVYFQARYEIQVFDSWGVTNPKYSDCGGVYERWKDDKGYEGHAPRVNASRAPGEWQSFDVTFRAPRFDSAGRKTENARFLKVVHNGRVIHENVEVTGPTRSATFENDEKSTGPLMLQGDHGPVAYRNLRMELLNL